MHLKSLITAGKTSWFLESLLVFCLSWLLFYILQFSSPYMHGYDGYYHIKYAYLMRTEGLWTEFPWAQFSLWRDHFADKEFLFHILLIPFTYFNDLTIGAKHATVLLGATLIASFNLVLRLQKVPLRYLWLVLLLVAGDVLLYRLQLPRPHLLSMILMLWLVYATINRRYILLAILSFTYAQAYTAMHMPIVLGIIYCLGQLWLREKITWKALYVPTLAVLASVLASPFFPNNLIVFFVQNLDLAWKQLTLGINLFQGSEIKPMGTRYFLLFNLPLLLPLCGTWYLAFTHPRKISPQSVHLLAITFAFLVLTLISKRFVEYLYPVGLLCCACFYRDWLAEISVWEWMRQHRVKAALTTAAVLIFVSTSGAYSYRNLYRDIERLRPSKYEGGAKFLQKATPKGETVFTCDWDDAPELFYFNHHNRYMIFMDPVFMYTWSPDIWQKWHSLANGRLGEETAKVLATEFKLKYGICTRNYARLKRIVKKDKRMQVLYEDKFTWVFQINQPSAFRAQK